MQTHVPGVCGGPPVLQLRAWWFHTTLEEKTGELNVKCLVTQLTDWWTIRSCFPDIVLIVLSLLFFLSF